MQDRSLCVGIRVLTLAASLVVSVLAVPNKVLAQPGAVKVAPGVELFTSRADLLAAVPTLKDVPFPSADAIGLTLPIGSVTISAPQAGTTNFGGKGDWKLTYDLPPFFFASPTKVPPLPGEGLLAAHGEDDYLLEFRTPVMAAGITFITNASAKESLVILDDQKTPLLTIDVDTYTQPQARQFIGVKVEKPFKYLLFDTTSGAVENEAIVQIASSPRNGMTWIQEARNSVAGTVLVGCGNTCNPYKGDRACTEAAPLLCIRKSGSGFHLPVPIDVNNTDQKSKWSGGIVATTAPLVPPLTLADANAVCVKSFGPEWRVAEFHDGWGWKFQAYGGVGDAARRFWVHVNDQPLGNCWQ